MLGKTDWKRLAVLLDQLHLCTGIKFALMDERGGELCTSNDGAPFCSAVLAHPCGAQCCHDCDRRAVETALATCRPQKYICHAGLYEVVYPVMEDTNVTAVILFGQILNDQTREAQWERVRQRCGWHPDQQALHSAFLKLRRVSDEQINACIEIVRPCVSEVRLHGLYDINT